MTAHGELTIQKEGSAVSAPGAEAAGSLLEVIARASVDPRVDIDKLERLLAMHERIEASRKQAEFNEALARVQSLMPHLDQNGKIDYQKPGVKPIPYALLEDIDAVIRPIYSAEGFSVAWNSKPVMEGKMVEVIGDFKHRSGHCETRSVTMPNDTSGAKSPIQAVVGTISYGKRTLLKMFFNLIEKGTDKNGADIRKITQAQTDTLQSLIEETNSNKANFLHFMKVEKLSDILVVDHSKALNALETKRRAAR